MTTKAEVLQFLEEFKTFAGIFQIHFVGRDASGDELTELEMTAKQREELVLQLTPENYYRGPSEDNSFPQFQIWEFGVEWNEIQIYVKLSTRKEKSMPVCLSFHKARFDIQYPFDADIS